MERGSRIPLNRPTTPIGVRNAILRARGRAHFVKDFPGPLSIKSVTEGAVAWKTGGRELLVDRNSFLVINHGEPYSMDFETRTPVGTLCVFFEEQFAAGVWRSLADEDLEASSGSTPLLPRLHVRDTRILPRMRTIAEANEPSPLWLDQQYLELARDLFLFDRDLRRRVQSLPAR